MDEYIAKRIEGVEKEDTALTNDVYFTDEGTVVKVYPRFSLTTLYTMITDLMALNPSLITRSERMRNEVEVKNEIKKTGLNTPNILYQSDDAIEFEMVPGMSGFDYLNDCGSEAAYELGGKIGGFLPDLHDRDVALRDFRISNMLVDHGDIYLIDHEYSVLDANRVLKWVDYLTLLSSVRQSENYVNFRKGFENEGKIGLSLLFLSILTAFFHSLVIERSLKRVKNVLHSFYFDIRGKNHG